MTNNNFKSRTNIKNNYGIPFVFRMHLSMALHFAKLPKLSHLTYAT